MRKIKLNTVGSQVLILDNGYFMMSENVKAAILFGTRIGFFAGLLPLVLGLCLRKPGTAIIGFIATVIAGMIGGVYAVIPASVGTTLAMFRKQYSQKTKIIERTEFEFHQTQKWENWRIFINVLFLGLIIACSIPWFYFLNSTAKIIVKPDSQVIFQIDAGQFLWCVPAVFLGIISSLPLGNMILPKVLGNKYLEYKKYSKMRLGYDQDRVMLVLSPVVVVACIAFFVCQIKDVTRFYATGISIGEFGKFHHPFYHYSDVKKIHYWSLIRDGAGHVLERPRHSIEFNDKTIWTTEAPFRDINPLLNRQAFEYASKQAGIVIEQ